jgi:hypothetical protein
MQTNRDDNMPKCWPPNTTAEHNGHSEGRMLLLPWSENSVVSICGPVYLNAGLRMLPSELCTLQIKPSDVRMLAMSYRRLTVVFNRPALVPTGSDCPSWLDCWQHGSTSASSDMFLSTVFSLSRTVAARSRFTKPDCKTCKHINYI